MDKIFFEHFEAACDKTEKYVHVISSSLSSHWRCIFIIFKVLYLYYFDSTTYTTYNHPYQKNTKAVDKVRDLIMKSWTFEAKFIFNS